MSILSSQKEKKEIKIIMEKYNQNDVKIPEIKKYEYQSLFGNQIKFGEFDNIINEFVHTSLFKIGNINLDTLIHNLKSLKIRKQSSREFEGQKAEHYYPYLNYLVISENYNIIDIIHALLHMTSRYSDGKEIRLGFSFNIKINDEYQEWGRGFNEGYVACLEKRYFPQYVTMKRYALQQRVMNVIEYIVGKENLEKYFFNANIESLIEDLEKYLPRKTIITLIRALDFITENNNVTNSLLKHELAEKVREINTIMRELAFGYFDAIDEVDQRFASLLQENQLPYYVYKNKKYSVKQKSYRYHM